MPRETPRALHRYAAFLVLAIIGLIAAGGLVKSLEAGLSVPDWPTSYGGINPPRWWEIENVRAEHGHRLIAGTVALLTIVLAVWARRSEPRRWVRRLAYGAVVAVLLQALLGGLTVLFFLPTAISVSHAALAQFYLCMVAAFAVVTSRSWVEGGTGSTESAGDGLRRIATTTTVLIYCQTLLGALVRHTGAGLAIPDFPRMFGRWWPPQLDFAVGLHLSHRIGALVVTLAILTILVKVWRSPLLRARFAWPASLLGLLLVCQVSLGATIIWSARAVLPNTLHVPSGAALLVTSLVITLRAWRLHGTPAVSEPALGDPSAVTA